MDHQRLQEIGKWARSIVAASVFVDPEQPGITHEELVKLAMEEKLNSSDLQFALQMVLLNPDEDGYYRLSYEMVTEDGYGRFQQDYHQDPRNRLAFRAVATVLTEQPVNTSGMFRVTYEDVLRQASEHHSNEHDLKVALSMWRTLGALRDSGDHLVGQAVLLPEVPDESTDGAELPIHPAARVLPDVRCIIGDRQ